MADAEIKANHGCLNPKGRQKKVWLSRDEATVRCPTDQVIYKCQECNFYHRAPRVKRAR